ncbi:Hypothetical protein SRAE_2000235700 [Strongyloides ratti]|uniref:Uncharacterized protein n=1 Tax=Strongyloides ratti TaxID=34506 RepID=A0A090LD66_STRRB|nr:Hypothetical protein SRAE_2000235700 [Strongyloides ratti]CEF67696.1 Hypothetical protein SRAE_2000235700 [Strongyloides ratti]
MNNSHCEKLSKIILQELMQDKSFQAKWLCDSLNRLILLTELDTKNIKLCQKPKESSDVIQNNESTKKVIRELIGTIDLSIETFLTNFQLAFCHMEFERNKDAATIYSNKVLLDRLISSEKFNLDRLHHFIRRLQQCIKGFTIRISGSFQVANCAFYAHALHEMFSNLAIYFRTHSSKIGFETEVKRFEHVSSEFYEMVEKRLSNYLTSYSRSIPRDHPAKENQSVVKYTNKYKKTQNIPRSNFQQCHDYNGRHNKIKELAVGVMKNRNLSESDLNRIKNKWKPLFDNHKIFYSSAISDTYGAAALRTSNNITKSILNKIKND